jgi:hypothetical protein
MRTPILLLTVAMFAVCFDRLVTAPSTDVAMAQNAGPVPTAVVNPRLGAPPPGGHLEGRAGSALGENNGGALGNRPGSALDRGADTVTDPALPGGRLGTMNDGRLGAPPVGAIPNAPTGATAPPAAGAVPGAR